MFLKLNLYIPLFLNLLHQILVTMLNELENSQKRQLLDIMEGITKEDSTIEEKVRHALTNAELNNILNIVLNRQKTAKSTQTAFQYEIRGDQYCRQGYLMHALSDYNSSIISLKDPYESGKQHLSRVLNKRADLFLQLNHEFRFVCNMISSIRYAEIVSWSELCTACSFIVKIIQTKTRGKWTSNLVDDIKKVQMLITIQEGGVQYDEDVDDIYDDSKNFYGSYLVVKSSPQKGRYMETTAFIKKNTVIMKGKVHSLGLDNDLWCYVCARCLSALNYQVFPCYHCIKAWYCSERCCRLDYKYHRFICNWLEFFDGGLASNVTSASWILVGLNTLTRIGFKRAIEITNNRQMANNKEDNNFLQVLDFFRDYNVLKPQAKVINLLSSTLIIRMLHKDNFLTDFTQQEMIQLGTLFHQVWDSGIFNTFVSENIVEKIDFTNQRFIKEKRMIGVCLYLDYTYINHSCVPNVQFMCNKREQFVRAIKDIEAGTEINGSYGPLKGKESLEERRDYFLRNHGFVCQCEGCIEEATTMQE